MEPAAQQYHTLLEITRNVGVLCASPKGQQIRRPRFSAACIINFSRGAKHPDDLTQHPAFYVIKDLANHEDDKPCNDVAKNFREHKPPPFLTKSVRSSCQTCGFFSRKVSVNRNIKIPHREGECNGRRGALQPAKRKVSGDRGFRSPDFLQRT